MRLKRGQALAGRFFVDSIVGTSMAFIYGPGLSECKRMQKVSGRWDHSQPRFLLLLLLLSFFFLLLVRIGTTLSISISVSISISTTIRISVCMSMSMHYYHFYHHHLYRYYFLRIRLQMMLMMIQCCCCSWIATTMSFHYGGCEVQSTGTGLSHG